MASKILVDELAPYSHATDVTLATGKKIAGAETQYKVTGGASGEVLKSDGSGGLTWGSSGTTVKYAVICDEKTSGTSGGTFTNGAWRIRDLNNEIYDDIVGGVSITTNVFTLPVGTYYIRWQAPAYGVSGHISRLYDVDGTAVLEYGTSAYDQLSTANDTGSSFGYAKVVIASGTNQYRIEHRCNVTRATDGFGVNTNNSVEKYTVVEIEQHT
jgi:hypothetical protein